MSAPSRLLLTHKANTGWRQRSPRTPHESACVDGADKYSWPASWLLLEMKVFIQLKGLTGLSEKELMWMWFRCWIYLFVLSIEHPWSKGQGGSVFGQILVTLWLLCGFKLHHRWITGCPQLCQINWWCKSGSICDHCTKTATVEPALFCISVLSDLCWVLLWWIIIFDMTGLSKDDVNPRCFFSFFLTLALCYVRKSRLTFYGHALCCSGLHSEELACFSSRQMWQCLANHGSVEAVYFCCASNRATIFTGTGTVIQWNT